MLLSQVSDLVLLGALDDTIVDRVNHPNRRRVRFLLPVHARLLLTMWRLLLHNLLKIADFRSKGINRALHSHHLLLHSPNHGPETFFTGWEGAPMSFATAMPRKAMT